MPEEIRQRLIEHEMNESYLDYAMSVIISRALPDVRDGLKPVHRRILYAMHKMGLSYSKPTKKSARIVGDTLGKYHPHGDTAVYDALVRLAQDFSLRYPLIKGQGNFGSIDGFPAAAQRYTEAKLAAIADELLVDIDKETVRFAPNYDNSLKEPTVLPAKLPNLLINGSSGIAVGMATNIPPHNINEVIDATLAYIDNNNISLHELTRFIKGPDFPTGGIIAGTQGIRSMYTTGRGRIIVKARIDIEENNLIVTEIPYMVNKTTLIESIATLVKGGVIDHIADIRDESDREGLRIVIIMKKNGDPHLTLNQLYTHTNLRTTFGVNMLGIYNGQPVTMTLFDALKYYLEHRRTIITKRTEYELRKAEERDHIVQGLLVALSDIDLIVALIKQSAHVEAARSSLTRQYTLTEIQANAILDMRLQKLTSLETHKLKQEHDELVLFIITCKDILGSSQKILEIIKEELIHLKQTYGDERRTLIQEHEDTSYTTEELIEEEDVVVTLTHAGYIKRIPLKSYRQQKRGGQGVVGTEVKDQDIVKNIFVTSNINYLLLFTNKGKLHWIKAHEIPEGSRYAKGKAIVNLITLEKGERVHTLLPVSTFDENHYIFFVTKNGLIKKTTLSEFSNPRAGGIKAVTLREGDELIDVKLTDGTTILLLATQKGMAVKFDEKDVRSMGRTAAGVRGVTLGSEDGVVSMEIVHQGCTIFTLTENGFGKRTPEQEYRLIHRGGKGVTNIKTTPRNGNVVAVRTVTDMDELLCMTQHGVVMRTPVKDISIIGRNTQGLRVMKLKEGDKVTTVAKVVQEE